MCTSCGCSHGEARVEGGAISHEHEHAHSHAHEHNHSHTSHVEHGNNIHFGQGAARSHAPGLSQQRMVQIEQSILSKNDHYAAINRRSFAHKNIFDLTLE